MNENLGKLSYLDSLRGLAALIVFFYHFSNLFIPLDVEFPFLSLLFSGQFAVSIFFVLSGYVLSRPYFKTKLHEKIVSGVCRRYFRLMVPVLVNLIIIYFFIKLNLFYISNLTPGHWNIFKTETLIDSVNFLDIIQQATWSTFLNGITTYNQVLWTMYTEFWGSIIVFCFCAFFGGLKNRWVFYLISILIYINSYYLAFILGALLADNYFEGNLKSKPLLGILLIVGLLLGSLKESGKGLMRDSFEILSRIVMSFNISTNIKLFYIVGASLILFVLVKSVNLQKILSFKPLIFLGEISFSFYLLHPVILSSFSTRFFDLLIQKIEYNKVIAIDLFFTLICLILFSYLLKIYVDDKSKNFSLWVYKKFLSHSPGG